MSDDEDDQFSFFGSSSKEARDEAMARVGAGSPDYIDAGLALIANLPAGTQVIGEDVRLKCLAAGLRYHHHNAHGRLIRLAVERGLLRATGEYRHMKVEHAHARKSPVYRVRSVIGSSAPPAGPAPTNAHYDDQGRFVHQHCAKCGANGAPFGVGVKLLKGDLGQWYCGEHRP